MKISSILVLLFLTMATLFGIFGKILLPDGHSNLVVAELITTLLPTGLIGIVLAGFFAAIMSSADTVLLVTSMTVVHDIYHKTFRKELSPEKMLQMSRWVTFILGVVGLAVALVVFNIVHLSIEAVSFYVALLPAIVFGFYWKKATSTAALWSIILGFITIVVFLFIEPVQAFIPGLIVSFISFFVVNFFASRKLTTSLNHCSFKKLSAGKFLRDFSQSEGGAKGGFKGEFRRARAFRRSEAKAG